MQQVAGIVSSRARSRAGGSCTMYSPSEAPACFEISHSLAWSHKMPSYCGVPRRGTVSLNQQTCKTISRGFTNTVLRFPPMELQAVAAAASEKDKALLTLLHYRTTHYKPYVY